MVVNVTDENYETVVLKSDKPVLLYFYATWSHISLRIGPIIEEISQEYDGKALFGKVDVDKSPTVTKYFRVTNLPTTLFIKNGEVVGIQVGAVPKQAFIRKLKDIL